MKKNRNSIWQIAVFVVCIVLAAVSINHIRNGIEQHINKNKSISRAIDVTTKGPFRGWYRIDFSYLFHDSVITKSKSISEWDFQHFKGYIKDSAFVVYDNSNSLYYDFIYKSSQIKKYNLDTNDNFYRGVSSIEEKRGISW